MTITATRIRHGAKKALEVQYEPGTKYLGKIYAWIWQTRHGLHPNHPFLVRETFEAQYRGLNTTVLSRVLKSSPYFPR